MNKLAWVLFLLTIFGMTAVRAHDMGSMAAMDGMAMQAPPKASMALKVEIVAAPALIAGKDTAVTIRLTRSKDGKPVTPDDLAVTHTQKIHLLLIDQSLNDYHHIHPAATSVPGNYSFHFTPRKTGDYLLWIDVTPMGGAQQYVRGVLGAKNKTADAIVRDETRVVKKDGLTFTLSLDHPPHAGGMAMGTIAVTDAAGTPFKGLEPVMGAYAHIVAFSENRRTILHIHPANAAPTSDRDRGGPELAFHMMPSVAGYMKLFAQVKVAGHDVFVPFGLTVLPPETAAKAVK